MKRGKEVQMGLIYVWQIKHKWIMEARKCMLSLEEERENICEAY